MLVQRSNKRKKEKEDGDSNASPLKIIYNKIINIISSFTRNTEKNMTNYHSIPLSSFLNI